MEIPSSHAGVVKELKVKVGDIVNQGSAILVLDGAEAEVAPDAPTAQPAAAPTPAAATAPTPTPAAAPAAAPVTSATRGRRHV